ncbi:helix-turn-helix transcriptional regulator [Dyella telluris]|uniref:Helix-turn-helix transcriptional regulator n=2 Tax=Dyella telluris TaxID=2763498 RepID=A0A7G8Q9M0_9GAMM|nr:helix-turn-helix transcriptional regulator [Dyella telluris]
MLSLVYCPALCKLNGNPILPKAASYVENRIRVMREARGLSLDTLATEAGTTNQQVSLLETGKRRLTVDWLLRLAEPLKCHPWELVASDLPHPPAAEEIRLITRFQALSGGQRSALLRLMDAMVEPTADA